MDVLVEQEQQGLERQRRELPARGAVCAAGCSWQVLVHAGEHGGLKGEVQGPLRYLGPGLWGPLVSG